eukprot:1160519-Pelagomonas_calceolata.AAC.7
MEESEANEEGLVALVPSKRKGGEGHTEAAPPNRGAWHLAGSSEHQQAAPGWVWGTQEVTCGVGLRCLLNGVHATKQVAR